MAGLIALTPKTKRELVDQIQFIEGKGYVKSQKRSTHNPLVCKGFNQVNTHSIRFLKNQDGELEKVPKSRFNVTLRVCASCGEVLDQQWDS